MKVSSNFRKFIFKWYPTYFYRRGKVKVFVELLKDKIFGFEQSPNQDALPSVFKLFVVNVWRSAVVPWPALHTYRKYSAVVYCIT